MFKQELVGTLRGFDDYVNMVLDDVTEYEVDADGTKRKVKLDQVNLTRPRPVDATGAYHIVLFFLFREANLSHHRAAASYDTDKKVGGISGRLYRIIVPHMHKTNSSSIIAVQASKYNEGALQKQARSLFFVRCVGYFIQRAVRLCALLLYAHSRFHVLLIARGVM